MACRFEVTLARRATAGVAVANKALDTADRIEEQLSVFRDSSYVSFINRSAASKPVRIERSLWELLIQCRQLHRDTDGAFDVTSAPLSRCWGFLRRQGRIPRQDEIQEALAVVGSDRLRFDHETRTIRFERPGVELNFGSIGKGYALDRMSDVIRRSVQTALLSAGSSSLLAIGAGDRRQRGWKVGIRHPGAKDKRIALVRLRDCAMSTSGSEEQFFEHEGKRYGHIIDPRSGQPAEGIASASVIAASAALTDALATAFYVGGVKLAERYCASHPGVMAILLESGADTAVVIGGNDNCNVEILSE
ncbi:MAG TPA: FAD:protein FMN transferase [Blastocatellia bacterium]|nr:FAD:protein FMN transferase [Blastocatellia bacterium]